MVPSKKKSHIGQGFCEVKAGGNNYTAGERNQKRAAEQKRRRDLKISETKFTNRKAFSHENSQHEEDSNTAKPMNTTWTQKSAIHLTSQKGIFCNLPPKGSCVGNVFRKQ
jgi:hypothetical protein